MIINNSNRAYGQPSDDKASKMQALSRVDSLEQLKEAVLYQLKHEVTCALLFSDLADAYDKMGLIGHKCKMNHCAEHEFEENFCWRKYYVDIFEEYPKVDMEYKSMEHPKSLDEIHSRLHQHLTASKENIEKILKMSSELHLYSDMDLLIQMYQKSEHHLGKLECKIRRAQTFGHDVGYLYKLDDHYRHKYRKHKKHDDSKAKEKHYYRED